MKLGRLFLLACLGTPTMLGAQAPQDAESEEDRAAIAVYTQAIGALVGPPDSAGAFHLAERIHRNGGRMRSSHLPEVVVGRMAESGYEVRLAKLAENGLWQVPRGGLFLMLRDIDFWPGGKIARLSIDVGNDATDLKEVAFKFRREEAGWVLIEKGPAENEA